MTTLAITQHLAAHLPHIPGYIPLSKETYDLLLFYWRLFPLLCTIQLLTSFYPTGKTSIASRLNLPGRFAWITMELPSPVLLVVTVLGVSWQTTTPLPWPHVLLMAMFLVHYTNRALVGPLLNPIMSPMHLLIWALGIAFNCINPVLIGGWLGGYGKVHTSRYTFLLGSAIWAVGFTGNLYHESILRQIRAEDANFSRTPEKRKGENRVSNGSHVRVVDGRVYIIPRGGLFEYVLFPHYLCEWIEWAGFTLAAGPNCLPAIWFVVHEISTMLPRALQGKRWYQEKFGDKLLNGRMAAVPFVL